MKALVLAGSSFLGRHLCQRLRADGATVLSTGHGEGLGYCDIGDLQSVRAVFGKVKADCVFQCAAATLPNAEVEEMIRVHVKGTLNVLRATAEFSPNAVVVTIGSAAEYGDVADDRLPIDEEQPLQPLSLFGTSKAAQTQVALAAAVEWKLRVLVARPFNLLGPGLPRHYLAAALVQRLLQEGRTSRPLVVANADATRDFVDVRDAAEALALMVERAAPAPGSPQIYNIASGRETAVLNVANALCELHAGRSAAPAGVALSRSCIRRSCGSAERLHKAAGWQPRIDWRQSLHEMWNLRMAEQPALAS